MITKPLLLPVIFAGGMALVASPVWAGDSSYGQKNNYDHIGQPSNEGLHTSQLTQQQTIYLQEALIDQGIKPGVIDGVMGPDTRRALARFQREHDLTPTGSLNERTARLLGLDFAEVQQPAAEATANSRESSGMKQGKAMRSPAS